ncbi:DoxX family membrane protein [Cyclobacteriaceae bacterium]|nr:DoxX family membrane protein [Cyclobacteriaceae bacterium]
MNSIAYFLLRVMAVATMLGHGIVRMPKLEGFSEWMASTFEGSMIPSVLVIGFSYALPFIELFVGLLLFIGYKTKETAMVGALTMSALIFGSCLIEEWEILPSQIIHGMLFVVLVNFYQSNSFCLDKYQKCD